MIPIRRYYSTKEIKTQKVLFLRIGVNQAIAKTISKKDVI